jgi:hypothetical protein
MEPRIVASSTDFRLIGIVAAIGEGVGTFLARGEVEYATNASYR